MSELYSEFLVKKESTWKDALVKNGLIAVTAVTAVAGIFLNPIILVATAGLGLASYFIVPKKDVEYEYLFVNGELDIDAIYSRSKRKRLKSLNLTEADIIAPINSHRMDYYNSNQQMKIFDYSSGNPDHKKYAIIIRDGGAVCKIIIEPDENMAQSIKNSAPSKVFLD